MNATVILTSKNVSQPRTGQKSTNLETWTKIGCFSKKDLRSFLKSGSAVLTVQSHIALERRNKTSIAMSPSKKNTRSPLNVVCQMFWGLCSFSQHECSLFNLLCKVCYSSRSTSWPSGRIGPLYRLRSWAYYCPVHVSIWSSPLRE